MPRKIRLDRAFRALPAAPMTPGTYPRRASDLIPLKRPKTSAAQGKPRVVKSFLSWRVCYSYFTCKKNKRINFCLRRSYQTRCATAVVSFNTKRPLYKLQKTILGVSPMSKSKHLAKTKKK